MKVLLMRADGSEQEADIPGLSMIVIQREDIGPMVASVADLENAPPLPVILDKYGPEGQAWYAKHPKPKAPTRERTFEFSGQKKRGMYVYLEKSS